MTDNADLIRQLTRAAIQVEALSIRDRAELLGRASEAMRALRRQLNAGAAVHDGQSDGAVLDAGRMLKLVSGLSDADVSDRLREAAAVLATGDKLLQGR